jgi:hypothetical protein
MTALCLWCGASFEPRTSGGRAQRFCCPAHRHAYATAARQYVDREISAARLTVDALKAVLDPNHNARVGRATNSLLQASAASPIAPGEIAPSALPGASR